MIATSASIRARRAPEAEVDAVTEGEVLGLAAVDDQLVRIVILGFVVVRGRERDDHLRSGGNGHVADGHR